MKPDDSSLGEAELKFVEERAAGLLNRADSWGVFPTPVDDLVAAAGLKVAPKGFFDPGRIMDFVRERGIDAAKHIRTAISKVFGVYDADDQIIHVDDSVAVSKQGFLKLHETGHHELPTHRKLFRVFQDCKKTLCPEIADQFEREANNFARYVLFQGDSFARQAADHSFGIMTPIGMAKGFGSSLYASVREYARTNPRACVAIILENPEFLPGQGAQCAVRRIEPSPAFVHQFEVPTIGILGSAHPLFGAVPLYKRRKAQTQFFIVDRNGTRRECVAEGFFTGWNVLVLVYPLDVLKRA